MRFVFSGLGRFDSVLASRTGLLATLTCAILSLALACLIVREELIDRDADRERIEAIRAVRIASRGILSRMKDAEAALLDFSLRGYTPQRFSAWTQSKVLAEEYRQMLGGTQLIPGELAAVASALALTSQSLTDRADAAIFAAHELDPSGPDPAAMAVALPFAEALAEMRELSEASVALSSRFISDAMRERLDDEKMRTAQAMLLTILALPLFGITAVGWVFRNREVSKNLQAAYETARLFPIEWPLDTNHHIELPRHSKILVERVGWSRKLTRDELVRTAIHEDRQRLQDAVTAADTGADVDVTARCFTLFSSDYTSIRIRLRRRFPRMSSPVMIGFIQDVTDEVDAERARLLVLSELRHRMGNVLQLVQSVTIQTLRRYRNDPATFADILEGRIIAISKANSVLLDQWKTSSLDSVINSTLEPWRSGEEDPLGVSSRISLDIPSDLEAELNPAQTKAVVLALHEIAVNASKHGALSTPQGEVHIVVRRQEKRVRLEWREITGPPLNPDRKSGYGTTLIRALKSQLGPGGQIQTAFPPDGFVGEITLYVDGGGPAEDAMPVSWPTPPA